MTNEIAPLSNSEPLDERAGLVLRYREPLIRYFRRRGVPAANAEDLAQECFARIFSLAKRDHILNEEAYLFKIASSVLANYLQGNIRRQTRRHVSIDSVEIREETIEVNSPCRVLEGRQTVEKLQAALKQLKPKTREIFLLNRLNDLSYTQIAVRFGLTPSAIEKHMITALAHLNKRLGDWRT